MGMAKVAARVIPNPHEPVNPLHGTDRVPAVCLAAFVAVWVAAAVAPRYRADWVLENIPTAIAVPLMLVTFRRFRFSGRAYVQITAFLVLHTVGSHYTYSEVPLGAWMRDLFGLARNHYDRVVHLAFGLLMVRPAYELAFRGDVSIGQPTRRYLSFVAVVAWSAFYECLEWLVAITADPAAGIAYLGTQGDVWDSQKDMALASAAALLAAVADPTLARPEWAARRVSRSTCEPMQAVARTRSPRPRTKRNGGWT
jgi:putative membrane protein